MIRDIEHNNIMFTVEFEAVMMDFAELDCLEIKESCDEDGINCPVLNSVYQNSTNLLYELETAIVERYNDDIESELKEEAEDREASNKWDSRNDGNDHRTMQAHFGGIENGY